MSECGHPIDRIELDEDDQTICTVCGMNLDDPGNREVTGVIAAGTIQEETPDLTPGKGLKHIPWDPNRSYSSRPYTPEEVELEMMGTIDLLERGMQWLVQTDQARYEAKMAYDLGRARKLLDAPGSSAGQREAWAMIETEDLYREWQRLEIIHKTRERALHNVRAKLSALQSIAKSIGSSLNVGGGFR